MIDENCVSCYHKKAVKYADMAELADALDLGSSGQPCRFDSCYPQAFLIVCGSLKEINARKPCKYRRLRAFVFLNLLFTGIKGRCLESSKIIQPYGIAMCI